MLFDTNFIFASLTGSEIYQSALIASRYFLGFLMLHGGCGKIYALEEFKVSLSDYAVVPSAFLTPVAWAVALGEVITGACLLFAPWFSWVAAAAALMTFCFGLAIAINLWRGNSGIKCGCGLNSEQTITWALAFWNLMLTFVAILVCTVPYEGSDKTLVLVAGVFGGVIYVLYLVLGQLSRLIAYNSQ